MKLIPMDNPMVRVQTDNIVQHKWDAVLTLRSSEIKGMSLPIGATPIVARVNTPGVLRAHSVNRDLLFVHFLLRF